MSIDSSAAAPPAVPFGIGNGLQALLAIQLAAFGVLGLLGGAYWSAGNQFLDNPSFAASADVLEAEDRYIKGWTMLLVVGLATLGLLIVWSYKTAKWAQSQGADLRHGPGWAIGGWFIPFANLAIPFRVLTDLYRCADPAMPRPIRRHFTASPGFRRLWGWILSAVAVSVMHRWSSTLFDVTDTEADFRRGLAIRAITPFVAALSILMLLQFIRATMARLQMAQHAIVGVPAPYPTTWRS